MPIRSIIGFSWVLAFLFIWGTIQLDRKAQRIILCVAVLYLINMSSILNRTHQANQFARQFDKSIISSIIPDVLQQARESQFEPPIKVFFNGTLANRGYTKFSRLEVNGQSYFEFGGGNQWRIHAYMKMLGYNIFSPVDKEVQSKLLNSPEITNLQKWPKWPLDGSVKTVDDVIIVNI